MAAAVENWKEDAPRGETRDRNDRDNREHRDNRDNREGRDNRDNRTSPRTRVQKDDWQKVPGLDVEPFRQRDKLEEEQAEAILVQMRKLTEDIRERGGGKNDFNRRRDTIREHLDSLSAKIDEHEKTRKDMIGQIDDRQRAGREKRNEMMKEIGALGFSTEEEIRAKIHQIESDMMRNKNFSVHEEKRLMDQISQLRKKIPQVSKFAAVEASAGSGEKEVVPLKSKIDDVKKELNKLRDDRRAQVEALRELHEERKSTLSPVTDLYEQRDALKKELEEIKIRRHEIKAEYQEGASKFLAIAAKKRNEQRAKQQSEKRVQQVEIEIEAATNKLETIDDLPFTAEISRLEALAAYTRGLNSADVVEEKVDATFAQAEEGQVLPKNQRNDRYMLAPTSGKKAKRNKKNVKTVVIKHSVETLGDFTSFDIQAPLLPTDIDECVVAIEKLLETKRAEQMVQHDAKKSTRDALEKQLQELHKRLEEAKNASSAPTPKATDKESSP